MPTILCSALIAKLRPVLLDPSPGVTWNDARLLTILSQAQREVCILRPEAYQTTAAMSLVAGSEQQLPAGSTGLFDVLRNNSGGRATRQVKKDILDAATAFRVTQAQAALVDDWSHDSRSPLQFVVSPPNNGSGSVIVRRGLFPPDLAAVGSTINLEDLYEPPLLAFALAIAFSEETQRKDVTKSTFYRGIAAEQLGKRAEAQGAMAPANGVTAGA